jgi:hypothetical protein
MHPIVVVLLILLALWILTPKRKASRIEFICDGCRAALQIGAGSAGTLARCPHCGSEARVPDYPKRTAKLTIIFRIACIPMAVVIFYGLLFCLVSIGDGLEPGADREAINGAYRRLAKEHHPDHGGDAEDFKRLQGAYEAAMSNVA